MNLVAKTPPFFNLRCFLLQAGLLCYKIMVFLCLSTDLRAVVVVVVVGLLLLLLLIRTSYNNNERNNAPINKHAIK